jgi:HTH-type transcriptional regulator/antitoxin HigA
MNKQSKKLIIKIHPKETLEEVLENKNMSVEELSIKTNYSQEYINNILSEKGNITSEFASSLEKALNIPAHFWLNLQKHYDEDNEN